MKVILHLKLVFTVFAVTWVNTEKAIVAGHECMTW